MRFGAAVALLLVARLAFAQTPAGNRDPKISTPEGEGLRRIVHPYEARQVSPVSTQNSQRLFDLMRAGQIYLSLEDAIALALENNLDVELERFLPTIATTDVVRAK